MARREIIPPARNERGDEVHPAFGMITASRVQTSPPGADLFDSDLRHMHTIRVTVSTASRKRDLNRDWLHSEREFLELEMSEAQWASFVSSTGSSGVPCTIRRREGEVFVPGLEPDPRLKQSIEEVEQAAEKALEHVMEAFKAVEERPNKGNIRSLRIALENAPRNIKFAGDSLTEHAENVVQRARADIEAMVISKAEQMGIEPGDITIPALEQGEEDEHE